MLPVAARLGVDANQREDGGDERFDPLTASLKVVEDRGGGRVEAAEHRQRAAGAAARRIHDHVGSLVQATDPVARLAAGRQAIRPLLRRPLGQFLECDSVALRRLRFKPRQEISRGEIWK